MNNNILYAMLISSLAGLSTVIGGLVVFFKFKDKEGFISFALSFSLSVMISISVFDLIPESSKVIMEKYGLAWTLILGIAVFMLGKITVSKINTKIYALNKKNNLYRVGILSMVALMIHNFPERYIENVTL